MENNQAKLIIKGFQVNCRTNTPLRKVMKEKGYSLSAYLAIRNGTLITDDEILKPGDAIELVPVVSGG